MRITRTFFDFLNSRRIRIAAPIAVAAAKLPIMTRNWVEVIWFSFMMVPFSGVEGVYYSVCYTCEIKRKASTDAILLELLALGESSLDSLNEADRIPDYVPDEIGGCVEQIPTDGGDSVLHWRFLSAVDGVLL